MLKIKTLTVKNFLSVGNQTQAINFEGKNLVLVIGENMDLGGDDAGGGLDLGGPEEMPAGDAGADAGGGGEDGGKEWS